MWKVVPGFKSIIVSHNGFVCRTRDSYSYKIQTCKLGYNFITAVNNSGQRKRMSVHRLVALSFIDNPENKSDVNHKDSNRANNHFSNLEWVTKSENHIHSALKGRKFNPGFKKERNEEMIKMRNEKGLSYAKLGEIFGISKTCVRVIYLHLNKWGEKRFAPSKQDKSL